MNDFEQLRAFAYGGQLAIGVVMEAFIKTHPNPPAFYEALLPLLEMQRTQLLHAPLPEHVSVAFEAQLEQCGVVEPGLSRNPA